MCMNFYIYTVHLFLYKCITCKLKSCLSNYCTFHFSYVTINTQKKHPWKKKFLEDILSLLLVRPKNFINITSDVFHCHAPGKNVIECCTIPCNPIWCEQEANFSEFLNLLFREKKKNSRIEPKQLRKTVTMYLSVHLFVWCAVYPSASLSLYESIDLLFYRFVCNS